MLNPFKGNISDPNLIWINKAKSANGLESRTLINKIKGIVDRTFYLSFDMILSNDPEFYDEEYFTDKDNEPRPWIARQINQSN